MLFDSYFILSDKHNMNNELRRLVNLGITYFILHPVICNTEYVLNCINEFYLNEEDSYNVYIALLPSMMTHKEDMKDRVAGICIPKCLQHNDKSLHYAFETGSSYSLPIFIHFREGWHDRFYISLDKIKELLDDYKNVKVIINGINYSEILKIIKLFKDADNVYFDISFFQSLDGVETLIDVFGDDRIVFGTGAPINNPLPSILKIKYANVSKTSLEKVSYGNILNLLNSSVYL